MKSIITICLFMLLCSPGIAQQNKNVYFTYEGKNLETFLTRKIRYPKSLLLKCAMPFIYVKFKIKNNKVDSLTFTNSTDEELNKEISKCMELTSGHWTESNTNNKWFIIPMLFHISYNSDVKGCDVKKIIDDQFSGFSNIKYIENRSYIYFPPLTIIAYSDNISKY